VRRRMEGLPGARKCFKYKFIDEGSGDACAEGKNKKNTRDAVSQAKKRELISANPVLHKVLNQGGHGTCVAYAFSLVMTTGLQEKYDIACDPEKFVEKVKALCPCWEGHDPESMVREWNLLHASPGAAIEDVEQRRRYNVKVEYTKITSFEEAHTEMKRQEALKLLMPCTMSTHAQGHELHAVALRSTVPGGTMEAVNSWGAKESLLSVTKDKFRYAIKFDPLITKGKGGETDFIPLVRPVFLKRAQEHAETQAAAEVAQQQRQQAEEAAQQAAANVQRLQEQLKLLQAQKLQALQKPQQAKRKREEEKARRTLKKKENTGKAKSKNSFDVVEKGRYGVTRCAKCKWETWGCQC
jgi:hypothetical protein